MLKDGENNQIVDGSLGLNSGWFNPAFHFLFLRPLV